MEITTIRAAVLGTAIGDALGVPVEFHTREDLRAHPVTDMRAYGSHNQPAGTWSDDTSMLLATLDSLCGGYDPDDIMARFESWHSEGCYTPFGEVFDQGSIVNRAFRRYRNGTKPLNCGCYGVMDNGNGSLMRIMPACLYAIAREERCEMDTAQAVQMIHEISGLTHAHVISKAGCGLYYFMVKALIGSKGASLIDALQSGVDRALMHYRAADWYNFGDALETYGRLFDLTAFRAADEATISSKGYVVATLEAAVWCLLNTDSFEAALLRTVNLGHDTDTVGAVAGGLAGLYYGIEAMPKDWLNALIRRAWIEGLCDKAAAQW